MVDSKSAAESEASFAILDMMSATVLLTDASGRVLWGNSASEAEEMGITSSKPRL